jgi:hypothetical protein
MVGRARIRPLWAPGPASRAAFSTIVQSLGSRTAGGAQPLIRP